MGMRIKRFVRMKHTWNWKNDEYIGKYIKKLKPLLVHAFVYL
jgi:hypothetical protein